MSDVSRETGKRRPGRPKGSKTKPKVKVELTDEQRRWRGRPKANEAVPRELAAAVFAMPVAARPTKAEWAEARAMAAELALFPKGVPPEYVVDRPKPPPRAKLQGDVLRALAEDFAEHGDKAVAMSRITDPTGYLKIVTSLLPKQTEVTNITSELTDEQLRGRIEQLAARLGLGFGGPVVDVSTASEGSDEGGGSSR